MIYPKGTLSIYNGVSRSQTVGTLKTRWGIVDIFGNSVCNLSITTIIALLVLLSGSQLYGEMVRGSVENSLPDNLFCVEYADVRILSGHSLSPALLSGDQLLFLGGYYQCNPVERGDLVLYRWGDTKNVAKFVRGLAGDLLEVREIAPDQWRLELNGRPLRNSLGEAYILTEKKSALIRMYARELKSNEVLLLGDRIHGSHDSAVFGLVKKDQLAGKLIFLRHKQVD